MTNRRIKLTKVVYNALAYRWGYTTNSNLVLILYIFKSFANSCGIVPLTVQTMYHKFEYG